MQKDGLIGDTIRSLGFLSRLPLPGSWFSQHDESLTHTARAFPLAGAVLGLTAGIAMVAAFRLGLPPLGCGLIGVGALAAMTGALHEDGLGDTADGFFGGNTVERRLEIMKDSRIGTFAAVTLIIFIMLKASMLATLLERSGPTSALLALIGAETASRAAMVVFWRKLPSARPGGLSERAGTPNEPATLTALLIGTVVLALCTFFASGLNSFIVAIVLLSVTLFGFARLCLMKIGGQTGDTLGAAQQIATLTILASLVMTI